MATIAKPSEEEVKKYRDQIIETYLNILCDLRKRTDLPLWARVAVAQAVAGNLEVELMAKDKDINKETLLEK